MVHFYFCIEVYIHAKTKQKANIKYICRFDAPTLSDLKNVSPEDHCAEDHIVASGCQDGRHDLVEELAASIKRVSVSILAELVLSNVWTSDKSDCLESL